MSSLVLSALAGGAGLLVPPAHLAAADQLGDLKAEAATVASEISTSGAKIDALSQRYDEATIELNSVNEKITTTEAHITEDTDRVSHDRHTLETAAVTAFVTDGTADSADPLFSSDQQTLTEQDEYTKIAQGDLTNALAELHSAEGALHHEETELDVQRHSAESAVTEAQNAKSEAQSEQAQLQSEENQDQGQIHTLIVQQQEAEEEAALKTAQATLAAAHAQAETQEHQTTTTAPATTSGGGGGNPDPPAPPSFVPPSNASQGEVAVAAAESQLGVPYVYAAEDPGVGFDCSGLTAWAWGQAGVSLDHYSGAQMQESAPVPISDLEPGDLLFYGPDGDNHVTMYIGGGMMIEAPHTGANVQEVPLNTTDDGGAFAGAGRP